MPETLDAHQAICNRCFPNVPIIQAIKKVFTASTIKFEYVAYGFEGKMYLEAGSGNCATHLHDGTPGGFRCAFDIIRFSQSI